MIVRRPYFLCTNHKEDRGNIDEVSRKTVFPGQLLYGSLSGRTGRRQGIKTEEKLAVAHTMANASLTFVGKSVMQNTETLRRRTKKRKERCFILLWLKNKSLSNVLMWKALTQAVPFPPFKWLVNAEWRLQASVFHHPRKKRYYISTERHKGAQ